MDTFNFETIPSQKRRIAIVTGANSGLGFETTIALVLKEIKVIMACRNLEKAEDAKAKILERVPPANLEIMELDLSSLDSVRNFAKDYTKQYLRLDLLINNAGIMVPPYQKTEDGFESQLGVNYLSHFVLTKALFPLLNRTENSRIVSLSSIAHKNAKINFKDINWETNYSRMKAYGQSKLACLLFAYELQRKLEKAGSKTISVAAHPGVSNTELAKYIPIYFKLLLSPLLLFGTHAPKHAAKPIIFAALSDGILGGDYLGPTGFNEMKGKPGKVASSPYSYQQDIAKKLWAVSEELTRTSFSPSNET